MAGLFAEIPDNERSSPEGYYQYPLYSDEVWPRVAATFEFVGHRDQSFFPGGWVSCREDGSAYYSIDAALDTPDFLEVIAAQTGTDLAMATVAVQAERAPARIGLPIAADYDAEVPFSIGIKDCPKPKLGKLIDDRAYGAMLGLAIGDAVGVPLEFSERDSLPLVTEMIGGGPFGLEPGEWTDDTSMALCLLDSLTALSSFNEIDVLNRFVRWFEAGENSVNGHCFDIGITTRASLDRFVRLGTPAGRGPHNEKHAGNGSLMRLAPIAIFAANDLGEAVRLAHQQSMLTHANNLAANACEFFTTLLVEAMRGSDKELVLRSRYWFGHPVIKAIAAGNWVGKTRDEISSSGYVVSTLEAALWCVHRTSSFEEAIVLAVNLGDDSDTVGAVTGQLAGALYGQTGIPDRWIKQLAWQPKLEKRTALLLQARKSKSDEASR